MLRRALDSCWRSGYRRFRYLLLALVPASIAAIGIGCADRRPQAATRPTAVAAAAVEASAPPASEAVLEPVRVPPIETGQFRVCGFGFHSPHELETIRKSLPAADFVFTDLSPVLVEGSDSGASTLARSTPDWFMDRCRPDLNCDVVVFSGEFAGAFFGSYGHFVTIQEMEEASCQPRCAGLFQYPREVFLLACNTLATKSADHRTPEEYRNVLLAHGYSHTDAQRVVAARYGPLGPSFRDAMRRMFAGVPRIYGFSSVAPLGQYTAPPLREYFRRKGDYARYLQQAGRDSATNKELLVAFSRMGMIQARGVDPSEPTGQDRALVCRLYDAAEPVSDRLEIVRTLFEREDLLSFVPTVEVFFGRNPPDRYSASERRIFAQIQSIEHARQEITELVHQSDLSVLKMQMANLARQLDWISADEHERLAEDGLKRLLAEPLSTEVADIGCELSQYTPTGTDLLAGDIPDQLLWHAEGYRLLDCLSPADPQISAHMLRGLGNIDEATRAWAVYALWRRRPLDDQILVALAASLNDSSADVSGRVRRIFRAEAPLSPKVIEAIRERDAAFAEGLARREDG